MTLSLTQSRRSSCNDHAMLESIIAATITHTVSRACVFPGTRLEVQNLIHCCVVNFEGPKALTLLG